MSTVTRAKFKVENRTETTSGFTVHLTPVYDANPQSENGRFYKYTPAGKIELQTINGDAAAMFKPGTEVYVDFTPANPPGA